MSRKGEIVARLIRELDQAHEMRTSIALDAESAARREAVRKWQGERLARTHADLLFSRRFGAAASFFLTDIMARAISAAMRRRFADWFPS